MTPFMYSLTAGKGLSIIGASSIQETYSQWDGVLLQVTRCNLQESRFVSTSSFLCFNWNHNPFALFSTIRGELT